MTALAVFFCALLLNHLVYSSIQRQRAKHHFFLENSPFKSTQNLSKKERKARELPPNAYNEMLWERTMNPETGRPETEKLLAVQNELQQVKQYRRLSAADTQEQLIWTERGPADLGGRTRALLFDPNDIGNANPQDDYNRVFAGAVSGGLWVNDNITDPNSSWTLIPGLSSNISITKIIADPNDPRTMYIASGESYTGGPVVGNGVWKSTDGGTTWTHIFGGYTGVDDQKFINGIFYINDIIARDLGETTELFISVVGGFFRKSGVLPQFHSARQQGLYKSSDNGANWAKIDINESNGRPINPNDLEIDLNNNIWLTTGRNPWGHSGGKIYKSSDGLKFDLLYSGQFGMGRTELEPSALDPNTFWVLVSHMNKADLYVTSNSFQTLKKIETEPNDSDPGIPKDDFTRSQAFYNLEIEVDSNDNLFVGGIDLFRSVDEAQSWDQLSRWYAGGGVQYVHADQHAIVFRPGVGNQHKAVFGNDGGIYYCDDLRKPANDIKIEQRNKGYNSSQFYYGSIDKNPSRGDYALAGGTQDNGTWAKFNTKSGLNTFEYVLGGDGAYTEIDAKDGYMIASSLYNDHIYYPYPNQNNSYPISVVNYKGSFINAAVLDKSLDVFYHDSSQGSSYSITRSSNFKNGASNITRTQLTNTMFDNKPSVLEVSPYSLQKTTLFMGLINGKLFRIDNASSTPIWSEITGKNFLGSISDISFGSNDNELFVTFYNYGINNIWYSKDAGQSWTSIEGDLPDIPVYCLLQNPENPKELIIGTPIGIWRTMDFTTNTPQWEAISQGINRVPIVDLDLYKQDLTILATTHGRGLFTSQFKSSKPIANPNLKDLQIFPTVSNGNIKIVSQKEFGPTVIKIWTISGQMVFQFDLNLKKLVNNEIDLPLSSGVYLVTVQTIEQNFVEKIIIK